MSKHEEKTNVMRALDSKKVKYTSHSYIDTPTTNGVEVAKILGQNPADVFKTLVNDLQIRDKLCLCYPCS